MKMQGIEKIKVFQFRVADGKIGGYYTKRELRQAGLVAAAKGGRTQVVIKLPDGRYGVGSAKCSKHDNFSRATGRKIALERALADLKKVYA